MLNVDLLNKIIFYFENAPCHTQKNMDSALVNKVKYFILQLKPDRLWEKKGIINKNLKTNIYFDFIIILNKKLIACKIEKSNIHAKFDLLNGIKLFDEIWFFTNIPVEKLHLHYKLENNLKIAQKFFGLNEKGEIALIKETH
jgi:hypothetical protein